MKLTVIMMVILLLVGCGGDKSDASGDEKTGGDGQKTVAKSTTEGRDIPEAWKVGEPAPIEKVTVVTSDKVEIIANYRPAAGNPDRAPALVCVPMLGKTKETYSEFTEHLSEIGIASIAIDVRGHGESTMGGSLRYGSFKDKDWLNCEKDINSAFGWLSNQPNIDKRHIGLMGASIGANLVLMGGGRAEVAMVIALSPGESYHGVAPMKDAVNIKGKPVYILATKGDKYSADSVSILSQAMVATTEAKIIDNRKEHGTEMFRIPAFQEELIRWVKDKFDEMVREELNVENAPKKGKPGAYTPGG